MDNQLLFEERQFIGANKHTLTLRIFLSLVCFIVYFYTELPEQNGDLLFFLGVAILVISVILLFVTHLHTVVYQGYIILTGVLGTRKVKIQIDTLVSAERVKYSTYIINNPVYNLHVDGVIKFYTGSREAVKLTDRDGLNYIIGTNKPEELVRVITEQLPPLDAGN
ncbi:MAG TPA: hypothetical protein VFW78_04785 [Bacteroidia bacterium]|nr:hypothetical protein [Bacteroidia bacterium]